MFECVCYEMPAVPQTVFVRQDYFGRFIAFLERSIEPDGRVIGDTFTARAMFLDSLIKDIQGSMLGLLNDADFVGRFESSSSQQ